MPSSVYKTKPQIDGRRRLNRAIERLAQGSVPHFAAKIVYREERTVGRWLKQESPIPQVVLERLKEWEP